MNSIVCWLIIVLTVITCGFGVPQQSTNNASLNGKMFKTDLDLNQLKSYLLNEKFLGILKICLFQNGPCDVIGRWVKPRLASALFNTPCEACSSNHVALLHEFLRLLHSKYPNILDFARPTLEKLVLANIQSTMGSLEHYRNSTGNEAMILNVNGTKPFIVKQYDERVKKALNDFNFTDSDAAHRPFSINVPILSSI